MGATEPFIINLNKQSSSSFCRCVLNVRNCISKIVDGVPTLDELPRMRVLLDEKDYGTVDLRLEGNLADHNLDIQIQLYLLRKNTHCMAFKRVGDEKWLTFKEGGVGVLKDEIALGFKEGYDDMGLTDLRTVKIGHWALFDAYKKMVAIASLYANSEKDIVSVETEERKAIGKLVLMICESVRFHTIFNHINSHYCEYTELGDLADCIQQWSSECKEFHQAKLENRDITRLIKLLAVIKPDAPKKKEKFGCGYRFQGGGGGQAELKLFNDCSK